MVTLAHGGSAGLALEIGFLAVPVVIFAVMAVVSSRRKRSESRSTDRERGGGDGLG